MRAQCELSDEARFYIYLLEKYSEYSGIPLPRLQTALDEAGLTEHIQVMYPMYHTERIENAFHDIDARLGKCKIKFKGDSKT